MCEFFANLDWLGSSIQCVANVFMAYVAYRALETWKQQSKAQKKTDFLDELTDSIHEYLQLMAAPVKMLKIVHIRIESHSGLSNNQNYTKYANLITYIEKRGNKDSARLLGYLNKCNQSVAKIQSLLAKGQVYDLDKYDVCYNSCKMLLWQHQRLQVVAMVIESDSMNWDNPEVQKSLDNLLSVDIADVEKHLKEQNIKYLEFVKDNYRAIY